MFPIFIGIEIKSSYSIWWPSFLVMAFNWLERKAQSLQIRLTKDICSLFPQTTEIFVAKTYLEVSPITTKCVFISSISVVWGKRLQISLVSRICEICSFASNQLKAIAKNEGHQMESLLFISIPINVGNICCYYWYLINPSN